jgi:FtsH-binding integral membrane protein
MPTVHKAIGFGVVGLAAILPLWGLVALIVKREPNRWFWRVLAILQVVLVLQLIAGVTLLATGHHLPSLLHLLYGSVFPAIVLVIAHVIGRGLDNEEDAWKVFAIAGFVLFGLTLRALTTGLGMP